jgi:hypothetical protein
MARTGGSPREGHVRTLGRREAFHLEDERRKREVPNRLDIPLRPRRDRESSWEEWRRKRENGKRILIEIGIETV